MIHLHSFYISVCITLQSVLFLKYTHNFYLFYIIYHYVLVLYVECRHLTRMNLTLCMIQKIRTCISHDSRKWIKFRVCIKIVIIAMLWLMSVCRCWASASSGCGRWGCARSPVRYAFSVLSLCLSPSSSLPRPLQPASRRAQPALWPSPSRALRWTSRSSTWAWNDREPLHVEERKYVMSVAFSKLC